MQNECVCVCVWIGGCDLSCKGATRVEDHYINTVHLPYDLYLDSVHLVAFCNHVCKQYDIFFQYTPLYLENILRGAWEVVFFFFSSSSL